MKDEILRDLVVVHMKEGRKCPYCNATMEVTSTRDLEIAKPEPGNLAVCFGCMEICKFTDDLDLRKLSTDELVALQKSPTWEDIHSVRRANEILKLILGIE